MNCPICSIQFQRLKPHLKNKKGCSSLIDFEVFSKSIKNIDKILKKTKEREKKATTRKRHQIEDNFKENAKSKKRMADNRAKQSVDKKIEKNSATAGNTAGRARAMQGK